MMTAQSLAEDGFVRIPNAVDHQWARAALDWIVQNRTREDIPATRDLFERERREPIKVRRLWAADPDFWAAFLNGSGVLSLVEEQLGANAILIRSAAFIKYPGGRATVGWHCDEDLWGHASTAGLTAWVPLTPVPLASGCLRFIRGSHRSEAGPLLWDMSHPYHKVMDVEGMGDTVEVPAAVGDCILMDKRTVHSSGPNEAGHERIGLVLAFACCDATDINEPAVRFTPGGWEDMVPCS
jgi:ectoine hydroxylase-related dioxygenase (phytanoyl-CoA dioxygenase family)